jgi:integrase
MVKMGKLYHEEIKERFLSTYDNEQTRQTIRNVFFNTELIESVLNKDIYDFSLEELGKAIENTRPFNANVARSNGRFLSQYISWAIEPPERLRKNTINPLKGVLPEWYDNFVDKSRKIHYSFNEFLELLEDPSLHNNQDKALLFTLFEGISGEQFSQIRDLQESDIDFENKTVYIKERDYTMQVSDECIKYLEKACNEKTYYNFNSKTNDFNERDLLNSPFVFKTTRSPRSSEGQPVGMSMLYTRMHTIKDLLGIEILTPNSLRQSGMIYESVKQFEQHGVIRYEQFAVVGEKYDYSKIFTDQYEYYNTHLMTDFINQENIKDLYNIDVIIQKR